MHSGGRNSGWCLSSVASRLPENCHSVQLVRARTARTGGGGGQRQMVNLYSGSAASSREGGLSQRPATPPHAVYIAHSEAHLCAGGSGTRPRTLKTRRPGRPRRGRAGERCGAGPETRWPLLRGREGNGGWISARHAWGLPTLSSGPIVASASRTPRTPRTAESPSVFVLSPSYRMKKLSASSASLDTGPALPSPHASKPTRQA